MTKGLVILVGLPGTGKSLASDFLIKSRANVYRMGSLTGEYLKKNNLETSEVNEKKARKKLRKLYGSDIFAKSVLEKIRKSPDKSRFKVIEGMRSPEEWQYLKKNTENPVIIFLESEKSKRIARLLKRKSRPLSLKEIESRENYEIKDLNIGKLKKEAKFVIENNLSKKEFFNKIKKVIKSVKV